MRMIAFPVALMLVSCCRLSLPLNNPLSALLSNHNYRVRYNTHPAIITQELHDRALAVRAKRTTSPYGAVTQSPKVYLLGGGIAHCNCCGKPLRSTNSKLGEKYLYYRCASWLRGEACNASRQQIREQLLEPQIDAYMAAFELAPDWKDVVERKLHTDPDTGSLEKRRNELRNQLRRLNYQYVNGLMDESEITTYEKRAQKLIREINSIVVPDTSHTIEVGEQMVVFSRTWSKADREQKHGILREMFEAIYVDTDTKLIVGVKPYAEFVPLFRQTKMVEQDYTFVLKNNEAAQRVDTAERPYVQYGSDGLWIIYWRKVPMAK